MPTCPTRARWIARADVAPKGATKRVMRRPSRESEGFLFSATEIDDDTLRAYRETEYRVCADSPFTLRIGQASLELLEVQRRRRADCSAFVTACNPFSQSLDAKTNAERQSALESELASRSLAYLPGVGAHPRGGWQEESFLVFGLSLEAARTLGLRHGQNAIVWNGADGVPQLILLR